MQKPNRNLLTLYTPFCRKYDLSLPLKAIEPFQKVLFIFPINPFSYFRIFRDIGFHVCDKFILHRLLAS